MNSNQIDSFTPPQLGTEIFRNLLRLSFCLYILYIPAMGTEHRVYLRFFPVSMRWKCCLLLCSCPLCPPVTTTFLTSCPGVQCPRTPPLTPHRRPTARLLFLHRICVPVLSARHSNLGLSQASGLGRLYILLPLPR